MKLTHKNVCFCALYDENHTHPKIDLSLANPQPTTAPKYGLFEAPTYAYTQRVLRTGEGSGTAATRQKRLFSPSPLPPSRFEKQLSV